MNYRVRRYGYDLGTFSLDELRQRRDAGELQGGEYVQLEGQRDWQPLDLVLAGGYRVMPPPLPGTPRPRSSRPAMVWGLIAGGVIFFMVIVALFVYSVQKGYRLALERNRAQVLNRPRPEALAAATKPIVWSSNTLTFDDAQARAREFRMRQWLDGYKNRGQRDPASDDQVIHFIENWITYNYGGNAVSNLVLPTAESEAVVLKCADPLALTAVATETTDRTTAIDALQRALDAFPRSRHRAYPKFYAEVWMAKYFDAGSARQESLESTAVDEFRKSLGDGSYVSSDQPELAEIFLNGWGYSFFYRHQAEVCKAVEDAGPDYRWLALVLDGQREINLAWQARGSGYASSVTEAGWQGFHDHLAAARKALTDAWTQQPQWPQAPARMIRVSLGDSDITEMRLWFDRTTTAQIDYPAAWSELLWGLRPRWYGNEPALLALGRTAVDSKRFDSSAPAQLLECIYAVESEEDLPRGQHLFARSDIWPELARMYDGYFTQGHLSPEGLRRWRTSYAAVAYFAKKYDIARQQMELIEWHPNPAMTASWKLDLQAWPLEIAARTGPLAKEIDEAEALSQKTDSRAAQRYADLDARPTVDPMTREFIQLRLRALRPERFISPQPFKSTNGVMRPVPQ